MNFSERLRKLRKEKHLSQIDLAEKIGIHHTQVGRYERGISRPSLDAAKKLAEALEVTPDFLIDGESQDTLLHDKELLDQFRRVEELGVDDKRTVKIFLDAFLTKRQIQKLVN